MISGAAEDKTDKYVVVNKLINKLENNDFELDEKEKNVFLTNKGIDNIEKIFSNAGVLKNNNFYDPSNLNIVHHVNQALRANKLFVKGKDYIVKDQEVKIIDELTGRILEGRRYGDGLHQAIEAKENLEVQVENQTWASITYQNYFKMYSKLCGCTGTAATESEEFFEIYNLPVVTIPTNKEMIRKDWNDQIFRTEKEKNDAIVNKVKELSSKSQPLLIFTSSINKSEIYSNLLSKNAIEHIVLNAKNHEKEADIIANAGKLNSVIITTSISGRGVDIQLGGRKQETEIKKLEVEKQKVKSLGGLFVIGTERMESRRVDNQARGRSGRQGDEGNSLFYVSLEDDLMRIFGSESINNILKKLGLKDGESIDHPWINKAIERAQQKVEARNFEIRKTLIKFDDVLNDQRNVIFSQRNEVISSKNIFEYSDNFLNELIDKMLINKKSSNNYGENNDSIKKYKVLFGKAIEPEDFESLLNKDEENIKKILNEKFSEKRKVRIDYLGEDQNKELEKRIFLQSIDFNWKSHIQYLEQLRGVVGLRSYGQKDPLIEYKKEAFDLFENLLEKLKFDLISILLNLVVVEKKLDSKEILNKKIQENRVNNQKCLLIIKRDQKISRNDRCEATGKKFKNCCGAL